MPDGNNLFMFDLLASISRKPQPAATKEAFIPAPAVAQAVMEQGQAGALPGMGGSMPPDPSMMGGGPPGGGGGGAPMPPDPAAAGAAPAPPPGGAGDAGGAVTPMEQKLDQMLQMMQQQAAGGAGGAGAGGKGMASVKIDPNHFHQITHKISVMEAIMRQMAEAMGLQVPAQELFNLQPPVTAPGQPAGPGGPAAGAPAGGASPGAAPGQPQTPPSTVATQLPNLPPVASKAGSDRRPVDWSRIASGVPVEAQPDDLSPPPSSRPKTSWAGALLATFASRN